MYSQFTNGINGNKKNEVLAYAFLPHMNFVNELSTLKEYPDLVHKQQKHLWNTETYTSLYDPSLWSRPISCRDDLKHIPSKPAKVPNKFKVQNVGRYGNSVTPVLYHPDSNFITEESKLF